MNGWKINGVEKRISFLYSTTNYMYSHAYSIFWAIYNNNPCIFTTHSSQRTQMILCWPISIVSSVLFVFSSSCLFFKIDSGGTSAAIVSVYLRDSFIISSENQMVILYWDFFFGIFLLVSHHSHKKSGENEMYRKRRCYIVVSLFFINAVGNNLSFCDVFNPVVIMFYY